LRPSEGFSQAGYSIHAAIGFEHEHHATWKVRPLNFSRVDFANPFRYGITKVRYMMGHLWMSLVNLYLENLGLSPYQAGKIRELLWWLEKTHASG